MTELGDFMEHMKQFRDDEKLFRAARPSKFFISCKLTQGVREI